MIQFFNNLYSCEKDDLKYIRKFFLLSRIIFIAWFIICIFLLQPENTRIFDISGYFKIGMNGYTNERHMAFFPLFPMVCGVLYRLTNTDTAVYIFNILCSYLSTILIWKISTEIYNYDKKVAKKMLLYWIFSPVAMFTFIPYTESILILLLLLTIYFYKKKENPYLLGLVIGFNCLNKTFALLMFLIIAALLAIDIIKNNNSIKYFFKTYIVATPLMLIYPLYCHYITGDIFYFRTSQLEHWHKFESNIINIYKSDITMFLTRIQHTSDEHIKYIIRLLPLALLSYFIIFIFIKFLSNLKKGTLEDNILFFGYMFFCLIMMQTVEKDTPLLACESMWRICFSLSPLYLIPKKDLHVKITVPIFVLLNFLLIYLFIKEFFIF